MRRLIVLKMLRNPKYPLAPLREHRDRRVETATAELGGAVRAREAADAAKRAAEQERLAAAVRAEAVRADEAARLARGELRAADLAHGQAWEYGVQTHIAQLADAEARAAERVTAARSTEGAARQGLAQEKADLDVVVKDQGRFDDRARRAREGAEEAAAEEVFVAGHVARGRPT